MSECWQIWILEPETPRRRESSSVNEASIMPCIDEALRITANPSIRQNSREHQSCILLAGQLRIPAVLHQWSGFENLFDTNGDTLRRKTLEQTNKSIDSILWICGSKLLKTTQTDQRKDDHLDNPRKGESKKSEDENNPHAMTKLRFC